MSADPYLPSGELQGGPTLPTGAENRGDGGAAGKGGDGGGSGGGRAQGDATRDAASKAKKVENVSCRMVTLAEKTRQKEEAKRRLLQAELALCTFAPAISIR